LTQPIFHLASPGDAQGLLDRGSYHTASLDSEGFIHCCTAEQLAGVMQRYYSDAQELVLLSLDVSLLDVDLVFENTVGGDELFPHVYGQINQQAVVGKQVLDKAGIEKLAAGE